MIDFNSLLHQFIYDEKNPLLFNDGFFLFVFTAFISVYYFFRNNYKLRTWLFCAFSLFIFYKSSGAFVFLVVVSAIVVTAVYILRVVGIMLMGPIKNEEFNDLPPSTWFERYGVYVLLIPIAGIGIAPLWLSDMILASLTPFIARF